MRPRLIVALTGRWTHRLTVVSGGAGLGKTTLLAQALEENRLAPQGRDVWIAVGRRHGEDSTLAEEVATAVGAPAGAPADATVDVVVETLWRSAPAEVCLVFDDVHHLAPRSPGAVWLSGLIDALPGNAHVVLASRLAEVPLELAGLDAADGGGVLRLGEEYLRFTAAELIEFAAARDCDPVDLAGTGGWPAIAELTAAAGHPASAAVAFLAEEVLRPLGDAGRRVFAVLCDLGGGDEDLVASALGEPVDLAGTLGDVPMVSRQGDAWLVPHALWRQVAGLALAAEERLEVRHRAVAHLVERRRFDEAFALVRESGLWTLAPDLLRGACLAGDDRRRQLGAWLVACPAQVLASPAGRLAEALHFAALRPSRAIEPLREAAAACRDAGDVSAELCAVAHLGWLAWFLQDPSTVGPELALRIAELAADGHPRAQALAAFGRATIADVHGDDATVLRELGGLDTGALGPGWGLMASWLRGVVQLGLGDAEGVHEMTERALGTERGKGIVLEGVRLRARWALGKVDDVLAEAPAAIDTIRARGVASHQHLVLSNSSILYSHVGDLSEARRCLDEGTAAAPSRPAPGQLVRTALATASLQLAEGDEDAAAATLRAAIDRHGLDQGIDRRGWRHLLPLTYVLVPETRAHWDRCDLQGYLGTYRDLAAGVVAARSGDGAKELRRLDLPEIGIVRSALHIRFAADLAIGLSAAGRDDAAVLLDTLGPAGRDAVHARTTTQSAMGKAARNLLVRVPAPPPHSTYLAVLGPLQVRLGGEPPAPDHDGLPADLRRRRVQELLAFLISQRSTTRAAISEALWPDRVETSPGNNAAVTLNYLLRALEPWRRPGETPCLVRLEGPRVRLVTGEHLHIDLDDFEHHVVAAERAERAGTPAVALEHHLAATSLYRGDLHTELSDTDWLAVDRERCRISFVASATRAAQLLVAHGDPDRAEALAQRALRVDPWAEEAHTVLAAAALARGDRSAALRNLQRCLSTLSDLGIEPSATTRQLQRRIDVAGAVTSR